ncbi:MerR family DNA-binding transcriptional regulator [Hydrogenibacillus sp. N12]|uniref:MerR family DNA-binding transcriptional regulator n=1 Tax=Hydrogenibacillus sp. N12 TaxID=2866627 RepID=UPI001C7DF042|nr:MerR family DNA-binding transcriptional regulator [Hydrogenibacillus sp. N12]QZA33436.1 MerR family DNA-binding transcriptional regulator [Hydrogenibacillus sp. N12]
MELLSIREAAKKLGVHPNRLREWEKKGLIRPIRLPSGHRRYPTEEIDRILKAGGMNETEADAVALYARISTKKEAEAGNLSPDRLARFGFDVLKSCGVEIEVISPKEPEEAHAELVQDLLAIVTSFSARIDGARGGRKIRRGFQELMRRVREE